MRANTYVKKAPKRTQYDHLDVIKPKSFILFPNLQDYYKATKGSPLIITFLSFNVNNPEIPPLPTSGKTGTSMVAYVSNITIYMDFIF